MFHSDPGPCLASARGQGETVLIVEDEPTLLVLLQEELEHLGYDVMSAISGQAALELIHSDADIDLVITDVVMPGGIGGYELATLIRDKSPRSAILYMSGNGQWPCERAGHPAARRGSGEPDLSDFSARARILSSVSGVVSRSQKATREKSPV